MFFFCVGSIWWKSCFKPFESTFLTIHVFCSLFATFGDHARARRARGESRAGSLEVDVEVDVEVEVEVKVEVKVDVEQGKV